MEEKEYFSNVHLYMLQTDLHVFQVLSLLEFLAFFAISTKNPHKKRWWRNKSLKGIKNWSYSTIGGKNKNTKGDN